MNTQNSKASILDDNDDEEKLISNENGLVAKIQEKPQKNIDALEMAVRYGNFVTVDLLLNSGLKFDSNKTWLHFAAKNSSDINVLKNIFDMVPPKNRLDVLYLSNLTIFHHSPPTKDALKSPVYKKKYFNFACLMNLLDHF